MKFRVFTFLLTLYAVIPSAFAQPADPFTGDPFLAVPENAPAQTTGNITQEPWCFNLVNTAPYNVYGSISSDYFIRPEDGIKTRHKSNFRLAPREYWEVCSTGPFYDGNKLELVIRTLLPIFTCKTGAYGNVVIRGRYLPQGGTETTAECQP